MHACPQPKKVTHCTSGRKHPVVGYSQFETSTDPPSPPKKRKTVNFKRKPSKSRIAAEKYKTKPINTPQPIRRSIAAPHPVTMTAGYSACTTLTSNTHANLSNSTQPGTSTGTITVAATP